MIRRLAAAALALTLAAPAAAQELPTPGQSLVLNKDEPGICSAVAAGMARHAMDSFDPALDAATAALAFLQAPRGYDDLNCNVDVIQDMLGCIVTAYARQRRALLDERITAEDARAALDGDARACAVDIPYRE